MAGVDLTAGAIELLSRGDSSEWSDVKPVLQVADIRQIVYSEAQAGDDKERYRLLLSDGSLLQQGMLATQCNDLVRSKRLQKGSVVRLTEFVCNPVRGRMIIVIIDLDVIMDTFHLIGDPQRNLLKTAGRQDDKNDEKKDDNAYSSSCVICLNAPIEGAFVPCGHMAGCMSCLIEIEARNLPCPVCRSEIDQVIRVYSV